MRTSRPARHARSTPPLERRPLLVTADAALLDEVLRLAAVAGVSLEVHPDVGAAGSAWSSAPFVLVGPDAGSARRASRRPDVALVTTHLHDSDVELWRAAVALGADEVLTLDRDGGTVVQRLAASQQQGLPAVTVAVVGARGGVGASSVSVALGIAGARRGLRPIVIDLDARGGGLDLVLGAEDADGLRWGDIGPAEGRVSGSALLQALPTIHGMHLLSCSRTGEPLDPSTVDSVVAGSRSAFDLVVLDVPRALPQAVLPAIAQSRTAVLVVAADVRGAAAGHALACALTDHCADLRVIARTGVGRGLEPQEVAEAVGFPLIGELRDDARAASGYERGEAPSLRARGPWAEPVHAVLEELTTPSVWTHAS